MLLFSFCDIDLPLFMFLWWLLPFLLGWMLGRLRKVKDKEDNVGIDNASSEELVICLKTKDEILEQLNDANNELSECRANSKDLKQQLEKTSLSSEESKAKKLPVQSSSSSIKSVSSISSDTYAHLKSNNLQIIEGIGPKMETLLKDHNVDNWKKLSKLDNDAIRKILDEYGVKYRMIDPSSWSNQAAMADHGSWPELISYQIDMNNNVNSKSSLKTDSKVEKVLIRMGVLRKFTHDDLKAIEGIGPKIATLLEDANINTWEELSVSSIDELNKILEAAGKRYALAVPDTWPQQAKLAANKEWDKLMALQDKLKGGRKV